MTREEILAMTPGRELDALVAEKVMMWTKDTDGSYWLVDTYSIRTWEQTSYPGFQPSTDIAAAWEVLERFPTHQITKMHDIKLPWNEESIYKAIVKANKYIAYGKTAPLAICRAALLFALNGEESV
ncbi:BC1872 family protein [Paenibacillus spongiae]|uniref:Phage ABA sandwich domain-containing protein n=1 Tax=Paenibacillus spongiae TaxID=2909671 RepID=A0ABY5SEK4_9BACL|nr:hypothetical protein [Paenibacillus spongiae]UVI31197.1 hypothetical protein L1F29_04965 [Paenibacillus spongiae]